jgi:hypothetical protein
MSIGKTLAAVLCLLAACDTAAFACRHHCTTGSTTSNTGNLNGGSTASKTPVTPTYFTPPNKIVCGTGCEWSDGSRPDVLLRLGVVNPLLPMFPIAFTGRFTVRSFDEVPNWVPRYSSSDWTIGGGLEVGITSNVSLWSELSHTAASGTAGCLQCLVSGANASKYEGNVIRIGFVLRN